jgi:hypothetical protein
MRFRDGKVRDDDDDDDVGVGGGAPRKRRPRARAWMFGCFATTHGVID